MSTKSIETDKVIETLSSPYSMALDKMVKNITKFSSIYYDNFQTVLNSVGMKSINIINNMNSSIYSILKTVNIMQEKLKPMYENIQSIINKLSKVDLSPLISYFNNFKSFNINISPEKDKEEILAEIQESSEKIAQSELMTTRQKRNWFKKLWLILSTPLKYLFFVLIIPTLVAIDLPKYITMNEAKREIYQLEQQQKNCEIKISYRCIIHEVRLYKGKKLKQCIDHLNAGEIVIVLEEDKEKLKVQILDTEQTGWILKKYSKKFNFS